MNKETASPRGSFSNLREFRRKDSATSTTSSLDALDFLADMCVEIDEIGTNISPSAAVTAAVLNKDQPHHHHHQRRKFFASNSLEPSTHPEDEIVHTDKNILKREVSEISPRSRSSLTPASTISRTLSKGFSFSSTSSNSHGPGEDSQALAILNGRSDSVDDDVVKIPLTLYNFGEGEIYLVPTNPRDIETLIKGSKQTNHHSVFTVSLSHADSVQHQNQIRSLSKIVKNSEKPIINEPTSALPVVEISAKLINPKHIYKTSCDTYRVQMSKGSKTNPNGKFSRNTRNEIDAFWLCEYALLLVERPTSFEDILMNGNYKCLLQRNIVTDPDDFALKLVNQLPDLSARGLLKPAETEKLEILLPKFLPQFGSLESGNEGSDLVQESLLPYSQYNSTDPLIPSTLHNSILNKSFFPEDFHASVYPNLHETAIIDHLKPSELSNDLDQKKRRRGGQTPVMVQRNETLSEPPYHSAIYSSLAPPVFLNSKPGNASGQLSNTLPNLSQINSSNVRQYPELSALTAQYVKQRSRSFEDASRNVDQTIANPSLYNENTSTSMRKFV